MVRKSLQAPYNGPFKIIKRISDRLYAVKIQGQVFNISTETGV